MQRQFFHGKIHRARVTEANVDYRGSLTVDALLLEASGILPYEKVQVINISSGERFETYAIPGEPGSGTIGLNGGAARLGRVGDPVIVIAYASVADDELASFRPRVVLVDADNRVEEILEGEELVRWQARQPAR